MISPFLFDHDTLSILDQRRLPGKEVWIPCKNAGEVAEAIRTLAVRGAPAIGIAAAFGCALAARSGRGELEKASRLLVRARPTAVNLAWAVGRVVESVKDVPDSTLYSRALKEAHEIWEEEKRANESMSLLGASLFPEGRTYSLLTHCNAGALACRCWGTALGTIRSALAAGKDVRVIACETRPLNQGSRLTCWELARARIDVTLIPDSSAAYLMRKGMIDLVVVGADRITKDAVFNKIGTYVHAVAARHHGIPFYVAAPVSTFDLSHGEMDITVEERDRSELAYCGGVQLVPDDVKVLNYAFDATPLDLVDAIVTEIGVLRPPYTESFRLVGKDRETRS